MEHACTHTHTNTYAHKGVNPLVSPASCYSPLLASLFVTPFVSSCPSRWFRRVEMQGLAAAMMCEVCEAQTSTIIFASKFLTRRCDVPISGASVIGVFPAPARRFPLFAT